MTLNTTKSSFDSNVDGIKDSFINAVAAAAGVSPSQVTINHVVPKTPGRRLLSGVRVDSLIDVHTEVEDAVRLHELDLHLAKHSVTLHQGHVWEEAHKVVSKAVVQQIQTPNRPNRPIHPIHPRKAR